MRQVEFRVGVRVGLGAKGCPALIESILSVGNYAAQCSELSVDGMTLQSAYVPHEAEQLRVRIMPPQVKGLAVSDL